jgi:hypothetical protein
MLGGARVYPFGMRPRFQIRLHGAISDVTNVNYEDT